MKIPDHIAQDVYENDPSIDGENLLVDQAVGENFSSILI